MNDIDQLLYKNYLIEQEMLDKLSVIKIKSSGILTESARVQLNEDVKDVVMTAIRKIMANIQEVWNKFKATVGTEVDMKRINQYEKYLNTDFVMPIPEGFNVPQFDEYRKMMDVKVPAFQESMLDDLVDEKEFTRKHFSFFADGEKSIKEVAESKVIKIAEANSKTTVDKQVVADYIKLLQDFKQNSNDIADDIKNLNNSSRSIENLLNQSVNAAANISDTYSYYFNEAEEEKETFASVNKTEEEKKEEQESKDNKEKDGEDKKKNSDISKKINSYFRICNNVLSTKFAMTSKMRSACTTIVLQFGKIQANKAKSGNETNKEEPKKEENKSTDNAGPAQVKI